MSSMTEDEMMLREVIRHSIQEGKLFELVFGEGRRLWKSWTEEKFRRMVLEELKRWGAWEKARKEKAIAANTT